MRRNNGKTATTANKFNKTNPRIFWLLKHFVLMIFVGSTVISFGAVNFGGGKIVDNFCLEIIGTLLEFSDNESKLQAWKVEGVLRIFDGGVDVI